MGTFNSERRTCRTLSSGAVIDSLEPRTLFSSTLGADAVDAVPPADVAAAAAPLVLGQKVTGDIGAAGETDEYTFTAAPGQRIFLDVQKVTGTYATLYLDFSLFRLPDGQPPVRIFQTTAFAGQPDIADRDVTTLEGGNYKLTLHTRQSDLAGYEFTVFDVPPPDVQRINIGEEASGAIEAPGNSDEFLFTAAPGQRIFLDVLETTGVFATLYLDFTLVPVPQTTPPTQVFKSTAFATRPDNGDFGPVTLAGGEYRLLVDARGQDLSTYRFKLVDVPPVDVNPVAFGAVTQGAIESAGSIDEWTFNVGAAEKAYLDVIEATGNRATLYLDFSLQRLGGATPVEKSKTTAFVFEPDHADAGPVVLEPGSYKLVVSARGMETSTYKFLLRHDADLTASGTAWAPAFVQALHDAGLGDGGFHNDSLEKVKTIPWANINRLALQLAPGLSLAAGDVVARGNYGSRSPSEFTYDPATGLATARFAESLPYDNYTLDVGTGYRTRLRLLPGDVNRDNRVNALDLGQVKQRLNRTVQNPGTGAGVYGVLQDANGDTRINALDLGIVKANLNRLVPAALAPAASPSAGDGSKSLEETAGRAEDLLATLDV